jgi:uncharacterized SAM-binding protein YcdF (DUF218 family)
VLGVVGLAGVADTIAVLASGGGLNTGILLPGVLGAVLCLWAVALKRQWPVAVGAHWRRARQVTYLGVGLFAFSFAVVQFFIWTTALRPPKQEADWLIVLGAGLDKGKLSMTLQLRMDAALDYLRERRDCRVIVTGGRDFRETRTEAEVMAEWLAEKGVEASRILVEDKATSTMENLRYSKVLLQHNGGPPPWNAAVVTSNFHLMRVRMLAGRIGLELQPVPASTPWHLLPNACLREYLAVIKSSVLDRG